MKEVKFWVKSDISGFFGLFTNNLTNILTMASLLLFVVGLPADMVYGQILPATGISILVASCYYGYMGYKLAKKTGRDDVTALPTGPSVTHMFLIVSMILGPVYWTTGDAILALEAGCFWCFIEAILEILGAFFGKYLRRAIPRPAMLGSLAGLSLTYISLNPMFKSFAVPYIGLAALMIILIGFVGNGKMPFNLPTGLVAIIFGILVGWISGFMKVDALAASFSTLGVHFPIPSISRIINGAASAAPFLTAAIPLGIYNAFETLDNLESASVAGDEYNTTEAMLCDGATSLLACVLGSPFPTACYIGHAGWKKAGARVGYSFANGIAVFVITAFGLASVLLNFIPVEAIYPILVFIGITITSQAFTSSDLKYVPAVICAFLPHLADWTKGAVDNALTAAGLSAGGVGIDNLVNGGVAYPGMALLGQGTIIVGMILGAIAVFVIDRDYKKAAITCGISAVLSFFGLIHASQIAINANPQVTIGYVMCIALFLAYDVFAKREKAKEQ